MGAYDQYPGQQDDFDDRPPKKVQLYDGDPTEDCPSFAKAFSSDNLYRAFLTLKHRSPARGPLATTISEAEGGNLAHDLANRIEFGSYKPGVPRKVTQKKPSGGMRELQVPPIPDRMVGLALHRALSPYGEKVFSPRSFGFRPSIGRLEMLAELITSIEKGNRWYVMTDDIKSAFDCITIEHVMEAHHQLLPAETKSASRWLEMIEQCLRGSTINIRGIGQGYPYSPLAWNVTMHYFHDKIILPLASYRWFRFADNFARCCQPEKQEQSRASSRTLLEDIGLELHKETTANLLDGESIEVLGYRLSHDSGRVKLDITDEFWHNLKCSLEGAHEMADPPNHARRVYGGYLAILKPLRPVDVEKHHLALVELMKEFGFSADS
jgi:hypothetical protein